MVLVVIRESWPVVREGAGLMRQEFLWGFAQAGKIGLRIGDLGFREGMPLPWHEF